MITATVHRLVMFIGACITGIGGLLVAGDMLDTVVLGWIIFVGAAATLIGNTMRVYWPKETSDTP